MSDMKSKMVKKLVDLRRAKKKNMPEPMAVDSERERYPYGTRLSFNDEEVKKLGIKNLKAGEEVEVMGIGSVDSVNIREEVKGGNRHDISVQIKKMVVRPRRGKGA